MRRRRIAGLGVLLLACAGPMVAAQLPADPLHSPMWQAMAQRFLDGPVVFDARVQVAAPAAAENALEVPVTVRATGLAGVERIVVIADLNPIPRILEYFPLRASPEIAFRFKVEQSTPIRAAARTADGTWHVGGVWLQAAGGGCTAPSRGAGDPIWQERLGEVSARLFPRQDQQPGERLRFRVIHPMDTGLASGIPVFHIDHVELRDAHGRDLARLQLYEPVSENPVISLDLDVTGPVKLTGHDIQGNRFSAEVRR